MAAIVQGSAQEVGVSVGVSKTYSDREDGKNKCSHGEPTTTVGKFCIQM